MRYTGDMSKEIWKDVPGYNGIYQASNYGNVRTKKNGRYKFVNPFRNGDGYLQLTIQRQNENQPKYPHLGRIIALTFCVNDDPVKKK